MCLGVRERSDQMADADPITLADAASRFGFKVSTLRGEATRGRLEIYKIGRKYYTTPNNIRQMIQACRVTHPGEATSIPQSGNGSSESARSSSKLAAAIENNLRLRDPYCLSCSKDMDLIHRSPHPEFGDNYEIQTFCCSACNQEKTRTVDKAGQTYG